MSNLSEQLNQIKVDYSKGNEKLLSLVKPIIKENNQDALKEVFTFLSNNDVSPIISSEAIKISIDYINGIKDNKEKLGLLLPVLIYIYPAENLSSQYAKERDEFIQLCEQLKCYRELSQYYLKCESRLQFNFEMHTPLERLKYSLDIAEACVKAGDSINSVTWNFNAYNNYFPGNPNYTPYDLKMRYIAFRASFALLNQKFDNASRDYFILYEEFKDKPEGTEYFRKSAVYAILSTSVDKNSQISALLGEEKMKSLPIYELLERLNKENIITSEQIPEFKKQLKGEIGYSDSYLNTTILIQNIKAISRLYSTISYNRISQITGEKIETILEHLQEQIAKKAVNSLIDQPNKIIYFKPMITEEQRKDASISKFCRTLQQFTLLIPK